MDHIEADATPAEEWKKDLNATCNRLSSQYLSLVRAASSIAALEDMGGRQDPRGMLFSMRYYYNLVQYFSLK